MGERKRRSRWAVKRGELRPWMRRTERRVRDFRSWREEVRSVVKGGEVRREGVGVGFGLGGEEGGEGGEGERGRGGEGKRGG